MTEPSAPAPTPREVAQLLSEIAVLMELNGRDAFRARAFANAARALEGVDADLGTLTREDRLTELRGVGAGIAGVIAEYVRTGRSVMHDELSAAVPAGLHDLLRIPGLGPKRIHTLHTELGIDGVDALERAAREGALGGLPGFGGKTVEKVLAGIGFARSARTRRRYPDALEAAVGLLEVVRGLPGVEQAEIAGALRRRCEVVDRIDLVAAGADPAAVLAAYRALGADGTVEGEEDVPDSAPSDMAELRLSDGMAARLRCVRPAGFVPAMVWETGSEGHLDALAAVARARGGTVDREGIELEGRRVRPRSERAFYERLGLDYVEPELREGRGEVGRAGEGPLPPLVRTEDLRGTFHCHTTASDGRATLEEMVAAARERGWSYLGVADHSRTAAYARGLPIARLREQIVEIDALNARLAVEGVSFTIFRGVESDILPDGALDYPDDVLGELDYVVGSVHSAFGMPEAEMTGRIIRAVRHPRLTILGHPTGRLLLTREGYAVDVDAVLEAAAAAGVAVEINANPRRLDLDWRHVRRAAELGIPIAVNPDAHSIAALDHVAFGINMARKAGLEPRQVLNTWPVEEIARYFGQRKQTGA